MTKEAFEAAFGPPGPDDDGASLADSPDGNGVPPAVKAFDPKAFDPKMFDIQLGAWFDQMVGTSTGGLLAIYCACGASREGRLSPVRQLG